MFLRVLAIAGGLGGAASLSQFPEYSQQYLQRLAGAVDALEVVVADFDASARDAGLSREAALDQMVGTEFLDNRREDMTRTFARYAGLRADLAALRDANACERFAAAPKFLDREIGSDAMSDFVPAVPLTLEGAGFAGIGYVGGWAVIAGLFGLLRRVFRRRRVVAE
jgi:hypothetical protein